MSEPNELQPDPHVQTGAGDGEDGRSPAVDAGDAADPDGDPGNLNPRDTLDDQPYEGDPDADPDNLNPREG